MLTLIIGEVIIVGIIMGLCFLRGNYAYIALLLLIIPLCIGIQSYLYNPLPTNTTFYRQYVSLEDTERTIYMDDWSQEGKCITIDDYYIEKGFWDWRKGFDYVNEPLVLKVKNPQDFNPAVYQEAKAHLPEQVIECE